MRAELAAANAAVDEAVAILRAGRDEPLTRIGKAAKDFLTEVDLASEAAIKRSLAASTPEIGFYGEEGGGADLDRGRVWVADPLDGTINYATGSPLCGVMLGLLEDGVPVLGVIDLPFLGVRIHSGAVADVDALDEGIVAVGDAFHRGGPRMDAFLDLGSEIHRRALRFRCVGAASVLWTWLAGGQIQGMFLAHNNPYDVVAGPRDRARRGRRRDRLRGRAADAGLDRRDGGRARDPRLADRARRRPGRRVYLGRSSEARAAPHSTQRSSSASSASASGSIITKPFIGLAPGRPNSCTCGSRSASSISSGAIRTIRWSWRITPQAMLPLIIQPTPPNILDSRTPGRWCIRSLTRAASCSS